MSRLEVTEKIITAKVHRGLKWADVAARVGQSKEWVTAAGLGQMTLTPEQAATVGEIFGLSADEQKWLMVVPYKGSVPTSLPTSVPTDPLIYRFHELVSVYGTTFKKPIHEAFGDGIMSAEFQDGPATRARPQGRPREHPDVRQVPALQDLLNTATERSSRWISRSAKRGRPMRRPCWRSTAPMSSRAPCPSSR
jgi:cyanate lyase